MTPDPFTIGTSRKSQRIVRRSSAVDVDVMDNPGGQTLSAAFDHQWRSILFWAMLGTFCILAVRLVYLQGYRGDYYRARSERNRILSVALPAPRGSIVDRFGQPFVDNVPNFTLTLTPADLPKKNDERNRVIQAISQTTGQSVANIQNILSDPKHRATDPAIVADHATNARAIQWMIDIATIPGAAVQAIPTRHYITGSASAALIGYIGSIGLDDLANRPDLSPLGVIGKTGLEKTYNDVLTGIDGEREIERDVGNREQRVLLLRDPQPGATLRLTVDRDLQTHLSDRLNAEIKSLHSPGGAAVAIDPANGDILALVSAPSFDSNDFVDRSKAANVQQYLQDPGKPLLNRAITGLYPSGSIIKPMIATAGLSEHVITPQTTVLSTGGLKVGRDTFPDWKSGGHGVTDVYKAIAESVNTYFYILGGGDQSRTGLGVDRIVKYLQLFGWGSSLGIDIPGEAKGFLPTKEWRATKRASPWMLGDTYHLSIGQGDLQVTPLQVADALATIANGGTLYRPHIVAAVESSDGQTLRTYDPAVIRDNVADAGAIAVVRQAMRDGVLNGSSRALQSLPVPAAGKTGTAQFGNQGKTHAWFAAFAPYDHPSIVLVVLVEAGGEGNAAALPVAKDILQWYFTRPKPNG